MRKRFLGLAMASVLLATACGGSTTSPSTAAAGSAAPGGSAAVTPEPSAAEGGVVLTLRYCWGGEGEVKAMEKVIQAWNSKNPDIQVKGISGRFDFETWGWISRYVWWFGYTISTLILGLALLGFAPRSDRALAGAFRGRTGGSFGFGALIFFVLPIVAVLLMLIVVAIPLGLFLLLGLALLYTIGYVAGAQVLGRMVVKEPRSRFPAFFAGWGILRGIALIPVLGGLVFMVTAIAGLGAMVIALRAAAGTRADLAESGAPPAPPPVPAPPPL